MVEQWGKFSSIATQNQRNNNQHITNGAGKRVIAVPMHSLFQMEQGELLSIARQN